MRVLIATPHDDIRSELVTRFGSGVTAVACSDFASARACLFDGHFDLLITDLRLGAHSGLHLVHVAGSALLPTRCIVFSSRFEPDLAAEVIRNGASTSTRTASWRRRRVTRGCRCRRATRAIPRASIDARFTAAAAPPTSRPDRRASSRIATNQSSVCDESGPTDSYEATKARSYQLFSFVSSCLRGGPASQLISRASSMNQDRRISHEATKARS